MPINLTLPPSPGIFVPRADRPKVFARALAAVALGEHQKVNPLKLLGDDPAVEIIKAIQSPAMANNDAYAGLLTQEIVGAMLDNLSTECIALRLGLSPQSRVSLNGLSQLIFPSREKGKDFASGFRQEGMPIKIGGMLMAKKTIKPLSLGVIATMSNEMLERSSIDLQNYLLQCIRQDTSAALDKYFWSTDPATAISPAGLLNGITPVPSVDVASDITNLMRDFVGKDGKPEQAIFIVHPSTMVKIRTATNENGSLIYPEAMHNNCIRGVPTISTGHHFPMDRIVLMDPYCLKMLFEFKSALASPDAAVVEDDTDPVQQGDATAAKQPTRSMLQTSGVALRAIFETDYILTRPTISYVELPAGWGQ